MAASEKLRFLESPILNIFFQKFHELFLGILQLIYMKGIDVAQPIWLWGCPTEAQKQAKSAFFVFLGHFWAYVGQSHDYIGWAT